MSIADSKYGYLLGFSLPVLTVIGFYLGGLWNSLTILLVFIIIPFVDSIIGIDNSLLSASEKQLRLNDSFFKSILYLWTIVQFIFLLWAMFNVHLIKNPLIFGLFTLSVGLVTGGIGITVAHELGHKKSVFDRTMSQFLLLMAGYMHFYLEHNKGHHVWVGTQRDPATSRKNQGFYSFWVQSVFKGYQNAWKLEFKRLKRKNKPILSLSNKMFWFTLFPLLFLGVCCFLSLLIHDSVLPMFIFFISQSIVAFTLLELVNYVEHYGLTRKVKENGLFERVDEMHSWNASHVISNFFLFQLQRHSDHHINAVKDYQILEHIDKSPQLPAGYPTMILMALIPPLWFRKVNPILEGSKN